MTNFMMTMAEVRTLRITIIFTAIKSIKIARSVFSKDETVSVLTVDNSLCIDIRRGPF